MISECRSLIFGVFELCCFVIIEFLRRGEGTSFHGSKVSLAGYPEFLDFLWAGKGPKLTKQKKLECFTTWVVET